MTILLIIWSFHLWLSWKENSLEYQWHPLFKINVVYNIYINILANKCLKIMRAFKRFTESILSLLISWFYMKLELSIKQMQPGIEHTCKHYFFNIMSRTPVGKLKYQSIRCIFAETIWYDLLLRKIGFCSWNICIYFHSTF